MTDNTQPEALDLADWLEAVGGGPSAKRCAALMREQYAHIIDLEAQLAAIGAGGVSGPLLGGAALAAPQPGYVLVPVEPTEAMVSAGYDAFGVNDCYASMLAAAPMSPINRMIAYSAATKLRELGFAWDEASEAWLNPAAPQQAAPVVDKRTKQQMTTEFLRRMDRQEDGHNNNPFRPLLERLMRNEGGYSTTEIGQLKYALDGFYGATPQQAAPAAEWLEQAYREGWAACRDAETIGQEAEDWAFGNSTANSRMIDMQQAAPQPEAQEPVMIYQGRCTIDCGEHGHHDVELLRMIPKGTQLYTAQPAPSGDAEDAARYRVIRNSIDLDEILNTVKDPGKWETPYAVLMRGAELDEAVDAARKEGK